MLVAAVTPYARIIRDPHFRPLWIAQVVSNFGDTLHYIALVVLLFRLTGSGTALAVLALAQIGTTLAIGPVAGVIVDRYDRRTVMIVADLLLAANTVRWSTEQVTQIVAASGAGALLLAYGTTPAFLFNAATFIFSATMLFRLPRRHPVPAAHSDGGAVHRFWAEARAGFAYARHDAFIGPLLLVQGLASFATGGTAALLVVLSTRHLHLQPNQFAWLLIAIGAGALAGPFLFPRRFGADVRLVFWPYVWRGLGDILLGLFMPLPVALAILFAYGVGTSTGAVTFGTSVQQRVPDGMRGRVFATLDVVWATGEIASIGVAGWLVDRVGIVLIYIGGGIVLTLAGVLGLVVTAMSTGRR